MITIRFKNTNLRIVNDHSLDFRKYTRLNNTIILTNKDYLCCSAVTILSAVLWIIVKSMLKPSLNCLEAIALYSRCLVTKRRKKEEGKVISKGP